MIGSKWPVGYVLKPQDMTAHRTEEETEALINYIDSNVVGKEQTFVGPFGRRKVTYCDYAATARAMHFVEDYILNEVLPLYGNIHTSTSVTSMQSSLFREEARDIMSSAVNASEDDVVLFAGHGCTGAIRKLISCLNIPHNPIVFFGPCEHHTNLLPWQEIGAEIVRISETKEGMLDLTDLESKLVSYQNSDNIALIGCFSAASSTTGILADDIATTILLHQYGALAFWDYSTAAPYVSLDMNPLVPGINQKGAFKDAMFFSGHKFVGGVQSPGILVAKKSLFTNALPHGCAGVPSFFLTHEDVYLKDTELFEESGTAAIVESVRAGIAMKIKETVGVSAIMERESKIVKTVTSFFRKIPEIIVLGSTTQVDRLAIFSIMVRHPRGAYLHHNFVSAVLNDMFGIQARGGCSCSGPYAQDLMGINKDLASDYEAVLQEEPHNGEIKEVAKKEPNYEMLRPGFVRISFPYFMSESEIAYILEAIKMVATEGWKLLPQYILNPETGEWRHLSNSLFRERKWLGKLKYVDGKMSISERKTSGAGPCPLDHSECLRIARSTFNKARKIARRHPVADHCAHFNKNLNQIRWFMLPSEAQDLLLGQSQNVKQEVPFSPSAYKGSRPVTVSTPESQIKTCKKTIGINDSKENVFHEIRIVKQRSESNSPAREEKDVLKLKQQSMRERCYSLCSALAPESQSNKLNPFTRQRLMSCGSQAENTDSEASLPGDIECRAYTPPNLRNTPDLVYVEGITKELATEIKSELREVIAQVEDVLSESNDSDHSNHFFDKKPTIDYHNIYKRKAFSLPINVNTEDHNIDPFSKSRQNALMKNSPKSCCNHNSLPATISAERFSEYLVGFTSDVVSEMKSEFRDVVNAVDGLISPVPSLIDDNKPKATQKYDTEKKSADKNTHSLITSLKIMKKNEERKNTNHLKNMLSSQDSGIHLTDRDLSPSEICETKQIPMCFDSEDKSSDVEESGFEEVINTDSLWHLPPKNIWNPTCEAIKEYNMIQDGDRVLICMNNQSESISLLHTLHQYQYYSASKGKQFSIGVASESSSFSQPLLAYLKRLGVTLLTDKGHKDYGSPNESIGNFASHLIRNRLCSLAKLHNYNVLAFGHHLDDVSENFIMSIFHNGYLQTMKANYIIVKENLRVIRPFIYVRENSIKKFADITRIAHQSKSPLERPKERQRIKRLLAEQEVIHPKLFFSLKSAMKPLLSGRYDLDRVKMKGLECM